MLNSKCLGFLGHDQSHSCSEVSCSTSNVECIFGSFQFVEHKLESPGMHVRSRYSNPIANTLRRVIVWRIGTIIFSIYFLHNFANLQILYYSCVYQMLNQTFICCVHSIISFQSLITQKHFHLPKLFAKNISYFCILLVNLTKKDIISEYY